MSFKTNNKIRNILIAILPALIVAGFFAFGNPDKKTSISAPVENGLVGYWNMDSNDISGSTLYDKSGMGNHGTIYGATSTPGKVKQALSFDGENDYVSVGNVYNGVKTAEFWLKADYPWLSGYNYRKQITINGSTAGAQTNYQMKLIVHKGSESETTIEDFTDISDLTFQNMGTPTTSAGIMSFTSTTNDPAYYKATSFSADTYNKIKIRAKSASGGGTDAQIFWNRSGESYSEARSKHFTIISDGEFHEYTIDLGDHQYWSGTIVGFRHDPFAVSGIAGQVDYIKAVAEDGAGHVYLNNHCQDDFDDIRFTKSDGSTELDHWRESYVSGDRAVFWIEFDSIPASPSSANFYIYYDNPGASSESNGANTFPFFDDFSGSSLDSGRWPTQNGSITVSNGEVRLDFPGTNYAYAQSASQNYQGILEFRAKYTYDVDVARFGSGSYGALYGGTYGGRGIHIYSGGVYTLSTNDPGNYHRYKWIYKGAGGMDAYFDDTYKQNIAAATGNIGTQDIGNIGEASRAGDAWYDWFFTRKYASPEPTWGAWGSEESSEINQKILSLNGTIYVEILSNDITATGWTSPTIYVDGVNTSPIDTSWHHVVITTNTGTNATSTEFGKVGSDYFDGILDEVRFYNRALSAEEILQNYNASKRMIINPNQGKTIISP